MLSLKKELEFLAAHAERLGDSWYCKRTKALMWFTPVRQRVRGPLPGDRKAETIYYPSCRLCTVQRDYPEPDTEVSSSDVAPMGLGFRAAS